MSKIEVADNLAHLHAVECGRYLLSRFRYGEPIDCEDFSIIIDMDGIDQHFTIGSGIGYFRCFA